MSHPNYRSLGPGQPPQRHTSSGNGFCVICRERIEFQAPQRPMCLECWLPLRQFGMQGARSSPTEWCHGCAAPHPSTVGDVYCNACAGEYAQNLLAA